MFACVCVFVCVYLGLCFCILSVDFFDHIHCFEEVFVRVLVTIMVETRVSKLGQSGIGFDFVALARGVYGYGGLVRGWLGKNSVRAWG